MSDAPSHQITREAISRVETLIRPHIRRTPAIEAASGDFGLDFGPEAAPIAFKLEFMQHTGTFKARGGFAHMLTRDVPAAGVVAASGGNHGAAVAYAARECGVPARIFVPSIASPAKLERIRAYGADLVVGGERYVDALAASEAWIARTGALAIHAYDQPETLLGQGTVGLELESQCPGLDTVLVAVGGGGLIGGIAAWYGGRARVIAVEPEAAPTYNHARAAGRPVEAPAGGVAADSLAPRQIGHLMFAVAEEFVADSVLVADEAIRAAQHALWDVLRVAAEPGGAAATAALLSGAYRPEPGERVGVVLCGANTGAVDFER